MSPAAGGGIRARAATNCAAVTRDRSSLSLRPSVTMAFLCSLFSARSVWRIDAGPVREVPERLGGLHDDRIARPDAVVASHPRSRSVLRPAAARRCRSVARKQALWAALGPSRRSRDWGKRPRAGRHSMRWRRMRQRVATPGAFSATAAAHGRRRARGFRARRRHRDAHDVATSDFVRAGPSVRRQQPRHADAAHRCHRGQRLAAPNFVLAVIALGHIALRRGHARPGRGDLGLRRRTGDAQRRSRAAPIACRSRSADAAPDSRREAHPYRP